MKILLLRHGRAGKPDPNRWPDDMKRPLVRGGIKRLTKAAKGIARAGVPEHVLVSPSTRTKQTAEVMRKHAGWPKAQKSKLLNDGVEPKELTKHLQDLHEKGVQSVALVGHEPHLSALASYMLTGEPFNNGSKLKKGGAASIEYHSQPGTGELQWMMPAKALAKLGKLKKFSVDGQGTPLEAEAST